MIAFIALRKNMYVVNDLGKIANEYAAKCKKNGNEIVISRYLKTCKLLAVASSKTDILAMKKLLVKEEVILYVNIKGKRSTGLHVTMAEAK